MSLGKRLQQVLRKMELTQTGLSRLIGTSNVVINRYIKDKTMPDFNFLNKLATSLNINVNWLITGDGPMFFSDNLKQIGENYYYNIPIISPVSCGSPEEIMAAEPEDHIMVDTTSLSGDYNDYFAFTANGESMYPFISHGDVVVVKQNHNWDSADDRICVVRVAGEVTLKKVSVFSDGREILLSPFNKDFSPILIDQEEMETSRLIGIAVMAVKNL
jgi:SOS-response transcriptional repressor LexA